MPQALVSSNIVPEPPSKRSANLSPEIRKWIEPYNHRAQVSDAEIQTLMSPTAVPADVAAALPDLIEQHRNALQPAKRRDIATIIGRLAIHFPDARRSKAEWAVIVNDFAAELGGFPPDIVSEAVRRHLRTSVYFPKIAELYDRCATLYELRWWDLRRLEKLARLPVAEDPGR